MAREPDDRKFFSVDDLPDADPAAVEAAYSQIVARHVLANLRAGSGMSLEQVARLRGVTKAAVHQLEIRPLGKVRIASLIGYLQAVGYDVDEDWVARSLTAALPARSQGAPRGLAQKVAPVDT